MNTKSFGTPYGKWPIDIDNINASSNIVSIGVGKDISFEQQLVELTGCAAYLFDGTPEVATWINEQSLSPRIRFFPAMIGTEIDKKPFYHHREPEFITGSLTPSDSWEKNPYCDVDVWTLRHAMRMAGIVANPSYLKISVGGGLESEILIQILKDWILPTQIAVETLHLSNSEIVELDKALIDKFYCLGFTDPVSKRELWGK
jgi:hypothetical protein